MFDTVSIVVAYPLLSYGFKWLAVDDGGQIGIFGTARHGSVPSPVMDHAGEIDDVIGGYLNVLPVVGGYHTAALPGDPSYWQRSAARGLFGFNWLDYGGPYHRFTVPRVPVRTDTLPSQIQQVTRLVHLPVDFAAMAEVDLKAIGVASLTLAHPLPGFEWDWLAVDNRGHAGMFSTFGYGPVPSPVMGHVAEIDDVLDHLDELPVVGGYHTAYAGNFSDWERKAERGLFGFDWRAIPGPYRRVTEPRAPLRTDTLPSHIQQVIRRVHLPVDFAAMPEVDLTALGVAVAWEPDQ